MKDLVHYSAKPLTEIYSVKQVQALDGDMSPLKPHGLWFSVEDGEGWREWCEGKQFGVDRLRCRTRIVLKQEASVLWIATVEGIDQFQDEYGSSESWPSELDRVSIDWYRLAEDYSALIIAPYQWERRLSATGTWYYGWDCSSGVVWDADAIHKLEPIKNPNSPT